MAMGVAPGAKPKQSIFPSTCTPLWASSKAVLTVTMLLWWYRRAVSVIMVEENLAASPFTLGLLPAGEGTPEGWTKLDMYLDGGDKHQAVLIRDGADEAEVNAVIAEGCRQAGVADDQASEITAKWMEKVEGHGYRRNGYMFERTGSKKIFQRFLGGMADVAEKQPFFVLEVGSWEGASAVWIAEHLLKHPESLLICIDTWDGGLELSHFDMPAIEEAFHWNIARAPNSKRVVAFKGDSLESLAGLVDRGLMSAFDAAYVDASHEMKDVLGDALLSFRLLKVGGVMIFDDYWMPGVAKATAAFEEALGDSLHVEYRDEKHLVVTKSGYDRFATYENEVVLGDTSRLELLANRGLTAQQDQMLFPGS